MFSAVCIEEDIHTREGLGVLKTDLCTTVCSFKCTEANESRVGHFHKNVVYTVDVDVGDSSRLHVLHNVLCPQSSVQAAVSI